MRAQDNETVTGPSINSTARGRYCRRTVTKRNVCAAQLPKRLCFYSGATPSYISDSHHCRRSNFCRETRRVAVSDTPCPRLKRSAHKPRAVCYLFLPRMDLTGFPLHHKLDAFVELNHKTFFQRCARTGRTLLIKIFGGDLRLWLN